MAKILFQGDSITDCGRSRENDCDLGRGYATNVAQKYGLTHSRKLNNIYYHFITKHRKLFGRNLQFMQVSTAIAIEY